MRISLKAINGELERRGSDALLAKGEGYFYFWGGEAVDWLDRTVRVPTLQSLTLEQWIEQFGVLRVKNHDLLTGKMNQKGFRQPPTELAAGKDGGAQPGDRGDLDLKADKPSAQGKRAGRAHQP